ncbi:RNA polymerase, partial [Streptomyces sp. SID8455]|nr:RNA polymerase [Streptomyces sp. SID8455]
EDEARRRLRLGLQLLSTANTRPREGCSPPGYGRAK